MFAIPSGGGGEGGRGKGSAVDESDPAGDFGEKVDLREGVGGVEAGGTGIGQGLVAGADPDVEVGPGEDIGTGGNAPAKKAGQGQEEPRGDGSAHVGGVGSGGGVVGQWPRMGRGFGNAS